MWPFFSALVLIFMVFSNEVEASSLSKLISRKKPSKNEKDGRDIVDTPRLTTISAPTLHPTSANHLDLNGVATFTLESSDQIRLPEVVDRSSKFKTSKIVKSARRLKNYNNEQIQHQDQEYNQEQLRQESVHVRQSGGNALGFHDFHQHSYHGDSNIPINKQPGRSSRYTITKEPPKELKEIRIREPSSSRNNAEVSAMNVHANREIGHPVEKYAHQRGKIVEENQPHAFHETDDSMPPSGYRRRKKINEKAASRKDVSDSHDQFSQQSQSPEHSSQEYHPELIFNDVSRLNNPYPDYNRRNPNGDHNPHYYWDQSGGSGSGSQY